MSTSPPTEQCHICNPSPPFIPGALAKGYSVKNICAPFVLLITILALNVTVAQAADRVQAGQWEMTIGDGAQSTATKRCVTVAHANVVNGVDKTFRESLV